MNKPKFSIITICYNAEKTIADTIKSVVEQNYPNIEYIIIDGGSKDLTLKAIEPYKYKIATLVSEPDKGLYDALNKGLKLATGDIIGLLHADDFYADNNVLAYIESLFEDNKTMECISSSVNIYKNNIFNKQYRLYKATRFKLWQFRLGMQPPHPGFFFKKEVLQKVGLFNTNFKISGDFDWLLRTIKVNKAKVMYTPFISVSMRHGGVSSSGFKSTFLMNKENLKSIKANGLNSNLIIIYLKYFIKIFQLK
ncbi:MAG: glycosyltransferase [Bacteroidetes bacterium]|nr:glycosyltransferase [Bacteroidota bacterium]